MTGPEVEFIPGYSLFFTNRGQEKLYSLLEVRNYNQFIQLFNGVEGLDNDQLSKIIMAGLVWNKKVITLEEVKDLIEDEFYIKLGKNFEDINMVIIDALANSGLLDKKRVAAIRKRKNMTPEEIEEEIKANMAKRAAIKGEDLGEVSQI
jgi:hypothetical protein